MNKRQERFVLEWLRDMNATKAAIRAGYSERTAYSIGQRLLKNVEIQTAIKEFHEQRQRESIATVLDVEEFLSETMRGEHKEEVVASVGEGKGVFHNEIVRKQVSMKDRIRAAELLGKRFGMFDANQVEDVHDEVVIINDAPEEDG
ncbi:MAG: terminase small subunit [Absicoccus sp.]|uniref:terminase small subunit n=1 Tax=Absicoccus sp. TaxID=2718527 RepID=UPI002A760131|nr:terminase small subunit [Absicoccus sp.]MDY3036010.1 terminase small subunit [Absicoccus sp.]